MIMVEENSENYKEIRTDCLLVLCEIGENYKAFCDDLEKLVQSKLDKTLIHKVYHAIQSGSSLSYRKYKKFIEKHRHTIDIIEKYNCLADFTIFKYNSKSEKGRNLNNDDYFFQYIQMHGEDVETIKSVISKIKLLGFDDIIFEEKMNFTGVDYEFDDSFNRDFVFLENMEVIPKYLSKPIKYRTKGSCYCIHLRSSGCGIKKTLRKYGWSIKLNSLIFDPNRLPNEITEETTIGVIQELANQTKSEYNDVRDSINLSVSTNDLRNQFEYFKQFSETIDGVKSNQEFLTLLTQMQDILDQLQKFGENFETQIIASNLNISNELMKEEKRLYLSRRDCANIID